MGIIPIFAVMKYIDLESSIKNGQSAFLKKIPRFVVKILIRLIRQEEINELINRNSDYYGIDFLRKVFDEFQIDLKVEGIENLPANGKCFFVANHPFGLLEGLSLGTVLGGHYGTLKAIGNDLYSLIPNLAPVVAVVNVFGKSPRDYILALDEVYRSDAPVIYFPSGEVSRVYHWKIQDCEWQKSFITKAVNCQRDVVPIYFYGRNSLLFYAVGLKRKLLGLKMNLELALLPNELFRMKNKTIRLRIGKPISWQTFDKTRSQHEWAQWVREQVYQLPASKAG